MTNVMTMDQVFRYVEEAGKEEVLPKTKQFLIEFAVDTGLRLSEILSLEWDNFKQKEDCVIVIINGLKDRLSTYKISLEMFQKALDIKTDSNKVFDGLSTKSVSDMMTRITKSLGYDSEEFTFHSFKKTAVSIAYNSAKV